MPGLAGHLSRRERALFVQEALDRHLRGLLEGFVDEFDLGELAVGRELPVGTDPDVLGDVGPLPHGLT